ncbi:hypothetical protein [Nostoc sp. C052]|uniref:hypothetical protein n=1 Tax=Nostoc sp. C052 TaxID=2576902 RepID=UPI0015C312BA|nr:hypothetical protein [Nostoc sp. C052]
MPDTIAITGIIVGLTSLGLVAYPRVKVWFKYQEALQIVKSDLGKEAIVALCRKEFSAEEAEKMVVGLYLGNKPDAANKMLRAIADEDNDTLLEIVRQSVEANSHIFRSYDVGNS